MNLVETEIPGVLVIEPRVFSDSRGSFWETFSDDRFRKAGIDATFRQDNVSTSSRGVLRGMHLQNPHAQAKLVQVLEGEVFDVAVDVRVGSATFGKWVGISLSAENRRQLFIPAGFAHGFYVVSERAVFNYKCSDLYHPESELGIRWDDPEIGIRWPAASPVLSEKDARYPRLSEVPRGRLPISPP